MTLSNRYAIIAVLGLGGMGAVYKARDLHFPNINKFVAVKEMVNLAPDPLVRSVIVHNFEREATLLATLDHRAIPRIYDYFSVEERSYLVLEYIDGQDLENLINASQNFLPVEQVVQWAIELCDVLEFLHTHKPEPIIFRDMKPSNVMVNLHNHIVLVDFGIAKTFQTGAKGTIIGTEGYSPPEQYRGEATPQADIYALGATLHHALTRRDPRLEPPFSFGERRLRQINPAVSEEMEAIVHKALQYNAADRFQSAREMKEALLGIARQGGFYLPLTPSSKDPAASQKAIKPLWSFECEDEIRGSVLYHDGMVYTGSYDNNVYAIRADKGDFVWKYPTDGGVVSKPAYYEGNLFFGSEDGRLHVVQTRSGRVNWTYFTNGPIRSSPTIAEGHVFIGSDDGLLHAVNIIARRRAWQVDSGAAIRSTPLMHHEYVYFGNQAGELLCVTFSGDIRWRFKARRAITSSPVILEDGVYFGSVDSTLYALDIRNGWVIWRFRLGKATISTPCIIDNLLISGSVDGIVYCVDIHTAKEIWRFPTQHQVTGSAIHHQDEVYFGSVDGNLYCLDYRTGKLRWKFQTQGPITGTPFVHQEVLYFGSADHRVYAIAV